MTRRTDPDTGLHSDARVTRAVGGFLVTEGSYSPAKTIGRHDHEWASVCIVLTGGYDEAFGRRHRRCDPGAVIVHPEGEHHEEVHDPVRSRLLTIEVPTHHLRTLKPAVRVFDEAWHRTDYAVSAFAYRLCAEIDARDDASALVMDSAILEILAALDGARLARTDTAGWLSRVRERLEGEFATPPGMQALAEMADVHPVHLARAFRRRFGCSVGEYVRRLQVGHAVLQLEDPAQPISDIAYASGFADQSHMTRRVLADTGLTPGAWRRRPKSISAPI